jgi:hypothetical protein
MKVKLLTSRVEDHAAYKPGDVIEVSDAEGGRLITAGYAERAEPDAKALKSHRPTPETADKLPPENAAKPAAAPKKNGNGKNAAKPAALSVLLLLLSMAAAAVAQTGVYKDANGNRMVITSTGSLENYQGAGTIAGHPTVTTTGLTLAEYGDLGVHQTVWTFTAVSMYFTDHTTAGSHASIKLYEGPQGFIKMLGATCNLTVDCNSSGLADTATFDFGVGTATAGVDNEALATTEQDVIVKIEGDLSDASGLNRATLQSVNTSGFGVDYDGHTTAVDYFFNGLFEANDATADDTCTVNGTITITWINLGDY